MKKIITIIILGIISIIIICFINIKTNNKTKNVMDTINNFPKEIEIFTINLYNYTIEETENSTEITTENIYFLIPNDTSPIISKMKYNVNTKKFKDIEKKIDKNIVIEYPELTGFKNKSIQNKVNKTIKEAATESYYYYKNHYSDDKYTDYYYDTIWIVDYTIEYIDKNVMSIVFRGDRHGIKSRGVYDIYAVNINLNTGEKIRIDELFTDSFKNIINYKKLDFCYYNTAHANSNFLKGVDIIAEYANDLDKTYNKFYIKKNKFMFILHLPPNADWALAIDYSDLIDNIKWENEVWAGVFDKEKG